jgi:hypothetical protein
LKLIEFGISSKRDLSLPSTRPKGISKIEKKKNKRNKIKPYERFFIIFLKRK